MAEISARLDRHWDKIALCFSAGRQMPPRRSGILWQQLPALLEEADRIAERDEEIKQRDAVLETRDQQIHQLEDAIAQHDEYIGH
jgi:hypothetical protein